MPEIFFAGMRAYEFDFDHSCQSQYQVLQWVYS